MEQQETKKAAKGKPFASYVIERMKNDTGFSAALRRADNPATEHQSWEHLTAWCDLENSRERQVFATIAASIARSKPQKDGNFGIGRAIAECYREGNKDGNQSDAAKAKLRRLLACDTTEEACVILRSILTLIASRGPNIDHGLLLNQLLYFGEKTRVRWAKDFYERRQEDDSLGV